MAEEGFSGTPGSDGSAETSGLAILSEYLTELSAIHTSGSGVAETSYYPALSNLLNTVGKTIKPRVRCIINLNNQGGGIPDGGLFTADQFQRQADGTPKPGQLPARGAIEAKGTKPDIHAIAFSTQVKNYLDRYGIVVATNLRSFLIVTRNPQGAPEAMEGFSLAANEQDFWRQTVAHPRAIAAVKGGPFVEFIRRACLHAAPLSKPKDVAWFLASYARDALFRVERQKELPALQSVRSALEQALGMKFVAEKGEHFFRSTLVQTLFYGVFSAWVRWHKDNPSPLARFDWRTAEWSLHVPFIRTLYEEVAKPSRLGPLGLVEVLDWTAGVLNRVDRAVFFSGFEDEHAVQYFYEPFLEAYDSGLRKELGVWYTPPEIVKYQVARVDHVLRTELNLPDGLADPNVVVLDPCCGTGAYLVEVLHRIAATLRDKGGDALVASDLKQAAMTRVFGFEIMPAPFVVSHLQLGSMLQNQGAPLSTRTAERVGVYLTNSLTGWEPPKGVKATLPLPYPELIEERDAAEHVKRGKTILVVIGNPPYNAFAGVSPEEEQGLVDAYKEGLHASAESGGWGIKKFNLDDLYVRFFRVAERRISEMSGRGVVSFISNASYLSDPSFVVMRQRFLTEFDKLWFDCMNGDSRETGKVTPDGQPDPSVFSTEYNREGIRVGTAICVMVRKLKRDRKPTVFYRDFWGKDKRGELLNSLSKKRPVMKASPARENRCSFRPESVQSEYTLWPKLADLSALPPINGLMEKRSNGLIDVDRAILERRMRDYLDKSIPWEEYKSRHTALTFGASGFEPEAAREKIVSAEGFDANRLCRYAVRPFETRWCYYTSVNPIWNRARPTLWGQRWPGNRFLMTRPAGVADPEGMPFSMTACLGDNDYQRGHAYYFPFRLLNGERLSEEDHGTLFELLGGPPSKRKPTANLSKPARDYLADLGIEDPDSNTRESELIWLHALAVGYSPAYLAENADGIRRDWPRIPLPQTMKALLASAKLGEQVAALLDTETEVRGVTAGAFSPLFKAMASIARASINDTETIDLEATAGWGSRGKEGVTMPGKGKRTDRPYSEEELQAIAAEGKARNLSQVQMMQLLGDQTCDVHLNATAYWRNIPRCVWDYHIGGYQVIKKWLSYREAALLGRALKTEEAREVTGTARRIAAIILLQPKLDENYQKVKAAAYEWPKR